MGNKDQIKGNVKQAVVDLPDNEDLKKEGKPQTVRWKRRSETQCVALHSLAGGRIPT